MFYPGPEVPEQLPSDSEVSNGIKQVIESLQQGDLLTSVNIKEACLHILIFHLHQQFLHFWVRNCHFQFVALLLEVFTASWVLAPVLAFLRISTL